MSKSPIRLSLATAENLAGRIMDGLQSVCEPGHCIAAGSLRRLRPDVGDIELVVIPRFSASLLPDVPGASLLELELNAWVQQGRLLAAGPNRGAALKKFYLPALGYDFKLEINISNRERWAVELAVKTGSAEFSHRLVTPRNIKIAPGVYGLLPSHCTVGKGWQVFEGETRLRFPSERGFIEWVCGRWVEPKERD